jgi:hypothetical protein
MIVFVVVIRMLDNLVLVFQEQLFFFLLVSPAITVIIYLVWGRQIVDVKWQDALLKSKKDPE